MTSPGSRSRDLSRMGREEYGNTSTGIEALRQALRRVGESYSVESSGMANTTPERVDFPLTSEGSFRPRAEPTFLRVKSPLTTATNFRVATQEGETPDPPSRGITDYGHSYWKDRERKASQGGAEQNLDSGNFLSDPDFDDLVHRMKMAGDQFEDEERGGNSG